VYFSILLAYITANVQTVIVRKLLAYFLWIRCICWWYCASGSFSIVIWVAASLLAVCERSYNGKICPRMLTRKSAAKNPSRHTALLSSYRQSLNVAISTSLCTLWKTRSWGLLSSRVGNISQPH